ncbi:MAG: hypothetical protein LBF80_05840, partial [Spirochaetaceae bacterium]|nr:hypothetical protein [Spirochaetaceae bacterium]
MPKINRVKAMNLKTLTAFAYAVLFSNCLPYPVTEQPEPLKMYGQVLLDSKYSTGWTITRVMAIDTRGVVLGEYVLESNNADLAWAIPVAGDENTPGTFWVELNNDTSGKLYYNEGNDAKFRSGGYYNLTVGENNIPVKSSGDLALIGKTERFPLNESYILLKDLNLSGEWEPIGKSANEPFSGVFNGRDHSISGITLPGDSVYGYIGLFGYVKGYASTRAGIKNLNLNVSGTELTLSEVSGQSVGILAGEIENALIEKVNINGPVKGLRISKPGGGDFYIGGIAGRITGSSSISGSSMLFSFEAVADSLGSGYIGGIAGYSKQTEGVILLDKCYNTGIVTINNRGQGAYAGGILGYHENKAGGTETISTISECYARNEVSASGSGTGIVAAGGIIGGATPDGLAGSRSCALMASVSAYATLASAGGLSGYYLAGSAGCYQLDAMEVKPAVSPAVNAGTIAQSAVTETL